MARNPKCCVGRIPLKFPRAGQDFCKWPIVADSPQSFLNFVMYGNHSQALSQRRWADGSKVNEESIAWRALQMCGIFSGNHEVGLSKNPLLPKGWENK